MLDEKTRKTFESILGNDTVEILKAMSEMKVIFIVFLDEKDDVKMFSSRAPNISGLKTILLGAEVYEKALKREAENN